MSSTTTTTATQAIEASTAKLSLAFDAEIHKDYKYTHYLPVYDEETAFPPLQPFEFNDRGLVADKTYRNLLSPDNASLKATKLTPPIGTEIRGLQLSELDDRQKDELALLLAERGVVIFRDQDFKDIGADRQKEFARYFGPLHIHPTGSHAKDNLEILNIYQGPDNEYNGLRLQNRLTSTNYHSDVSYERQTPGITILTLLSVPPTGGDTAWASQTTAYARLSQPIKTLLEGLRAEHSGFPQAESATKGGKFVRRQPIKTEHPIVRIHPATGQKALYVNPGFTTRIVGLKDEESDALLKLLFKHITKGQDFQVRVKWEEGTVALWDNRITAHTAIKDYDVHNPQEGARHGIRLTSLAEKPIGVNGLTSQW
ncbi:related to E.coli dioxygenase [Cephalotrichum gorgonifer]|uniref:Related to E.coli dioxygenase n=1 Tax=Cephalotrichum gorgonifer TaxID=2041049 RepID=A0AAE8SV60_9PEZI|nr:related to E.coli dioxygenase [Cephalotrichum gorgonifer]